MYAFGSLEWTVVLLGTRLWFILKLFLRMEDQGVDSIFVIASYVIDPILSSISHL